MKNSFRILVILSVILVNAGCDQISKHAIRSNILPGETVSLIGDNFIMTNVENSGAFLSLGDSLPDLLKDILLTYLPLLVLLVFFVYILIKPGMNRISLFAMCCILGGGLGNIFDRAMYGSVTDFLHIDLYFLRTGIFNMADVSIMAGMVMIIFDLFIRRNKSAAV